MATHFVSSVFYAAQTVWAIGVTLAVGALRRPTSPTAGNERTYRVSSITTGITAGSEPTWPLTANGTVVDGGVTWTECSGQEAYCTAGNWGAAAAHIDVIATNTNGRGSVAGTDWIMVDAAHVELTHTTVRDWSRLGKVRIVTVSGSSMPPIAANFAATRVVVQTTGATHFDISGTFDVEGIEFRAGSAANTASLRIGRSGTAGLGCFRNSKIVLSNTSASSRLQLGNVGAGSLTLDNTPIDFGAVGQQISFSIANANFVWINTPTALPGSAPTTLFGTSAINNNIRIENVDLSTLAATMFTLAGGAGEHAGTISVRRCQTHISATMANNYKVRGPADAIEFIGCDDATNNKLSKLRKGTMKGFIESNFRVYHNSAREDIDAARFSLKLTAELAANGLATRHLHPIIALPEVRNVTVGSPITATVEVMSCVSALLNKASLWLEAVYLGNSSSPMGTSIVNNVADAPGGTPTAGTASTEAWGAGVSARVNSASYGLGDEIKVASNAGRVFVCTVAAAASGSEPAAYATAVDGDLVVDGSATFRCCMRQKITVTFTPQRAGLIGFYVHVIRDGHTTDRATYVDPTVILS